MDFPTVEAKTSLRPARCSAGGMLLGPIRFSGAGVSAGFDASDVFQIYAHGFDAEPPGHKGAEDGCSHEDVEQGGRSDIAEEDGKKERCHDGADLGERGCEACPRAADLCREDLSGDEVGHCVRAEVRHEIEEHEPSENQDRLGEPGCQVGGERGKEKPGGAAEKPEDLELHAAEFVREEDRADDADQKEDIQEGGALGGDHVVVDDCGQIGFAEVRVSQDRAEDCRGEDSDAIGAEILEKPRHRGEDRGAPVFLVEELGEFRFVPLVFRLIVGDFLEGDSQGIRWIAPEQAQSRRLRLGNPPARHQPLRALGDEKPSDHDQNCRDDCRRIHEPPVRQTRVGFKDHVSDHGSEQCSDRLEGERAQDEPAAAVAGDALRDHEVRGRVVAAERQTHAEEENQEQRKCRAERHRHQEDQKQNHLRDEELLPSQMVRQATQRGGSDENAKKRGRSNHPFLRVPEMELHGDERQRNTGHEDHKPLEEFSRGRQPPDLPLHDRHGNLRDRGSIRPDRSLVDILLNGFFQSCFPFLSEMPQGDKEDKARLVTILSRGPGCQTRPLGGFVPRLRVRSATSAGQFMRMGGKLWPTPVVTKTLESGP